MRKQTGKIMFITDVCRVRKVLCVYVGPFKDLTACFIECWKHAFATGICVNGLWISWQDLILLCLTGDYLDHFKCFHIAAFVHTLLIGVG